MRPSQQAPLRVLPVRPFVSLSVFPAIGSKLENPKMA